MAAFMENKASILRNLGCYFTSIEGFGRAAYERQPKHIPSHVIYSGNATIAIFPDGKKIVSRPRGDDEYDKEVGLAMCIAKRVYGGRKEFLEAVEGATIQNKEEKCKTKKYWHELSDEQQEALIPGNLVTPLTDLTEYLQPDWCLWPAALSMTRAKGCHYLLLGWVHGKEAIICANCKYSKTFMEMMETL